MGRTVNLDLPPEPAFDRAVAALQGAGCEITLQARPSAAKFNWFKQSLMSTSGIRVRYAGDLTVVPAGGQSGVGLNLQLDGGSAAPVYLLYCVAFLVLIFLIGPVLAFLLTVIGVGMTIWTLGSKTPNDAARDLLNRIVAGAGSVAGAAASIQQPSPAPPIAAPSASPATSPAPVATANEYLDQIKKLAELRDAGAISHDEFEAKKAELLSRV
jgi:hypothetical protein